MDVNGIPVQPDTREDEDQREIETWEDDGGAVQ